MSDSEFCIDNESRRSPTRLDVAGIVLIKELSGRCDGQLGIEHGSVPCEKTVCMQERKDVRLLEDLGVNPDLRTGFSLCIILLVLGKCPTAPTQE